MEGPADPEPDPQSHSTIAEFEAACAAMGDADDEALILAVIGRIEAVYHTLSDADKASVAGQWAYVQNYAESLRSGNPDAGIQTLASKLIKGEKFTVNVVKVLDGKAVDSVTLTKTCLQSTGHSGYNHSTNLRDLADSSGFTGYKGYSWNNSGIVPSRFTGIGNCPDNNYCSIHYQVDGSAPYAAQETLYLFYETPTLYYDANGGIFNDGKNSSVISVTQNDETTTSDFTITSDEPLRPGYKFYGWATSSSFKAEDFDVNDPRCYVAGDVIKVTATTTLYAVWDKDNAPQAIKLSYHANGGENAPLPQTGSKGDEFTVEGQGSTVRPGYKFLGWSSDKDIPAEEFDSSMSDCYIGGEEVLLYENLTLYAVWLKKITVTWLDGYSDSPLKQESIEKGMDYAGLYPANPTREGYEFTGWGEPETDAEGNITITAQWKECTGSEADPDVISVKLRFVDEDDAIVEADTFWFDKGGEYDVADEAKILPSGYEANGPIQGDPTSGVADSDKIVIVPVKKSTGDEGGTGSDQESGKVTILIVFVDEDGNVVEQDAFNAVKDSDYDATAKIKEIPAGYEQDGDPTGDPVTGIADSDKSITVPVKRLADDNPTGRMITVTWWNGYNDDAPIRFISIAKDADYSNRWPAKPERDGWWFKSWEGPMEDGDGNISYIATWEEIRDGGHLEKKITVTWLDGYSDDPIIRVKRVDKGIDLQGDELAELYPVAPIRSGYAFTGWGEPETDADGNITITAHWNINREEVIVPGPDDGPTPTPGPVDPTPGTDVPEEPTPTPGPDEPVLVPAPDDPQPTPVPATEQPAGESSLIDAVVDFLQTPVIPMASPAVHDGDAAVDIADDGTPLSAFDHPFCWVHYYIILGLIITAIYGGGVIARRLGYNHKIRRYEDGVTGCERRKGVPAEPAEKATQPTI